jgi:choline dehydrogenase-like flavoprotein
VSAEEEEYDVIVVGSGAAGAAISWRLGTLGVNVLCLEQGRRYSPEEFPSNAVNWESRKLSSFSPNPNIRKGEHDYPVNNNGSPIEIANFNAVGGSTVIFSGHFPRFQATDFLTKQIDGVGEDWPIQYQDLADYYGLNEKVQGVSGLVGDPKYPDIQELAPPISIGKIGHKIGNAFNELGWHWWPSYSAIVTKATNHRNPCINLGTCNTGCSQGAKSSADVSYWPMAIDSGVKLLAECTVSKILSADKNKVSGVEYFNSTGDLKVSKAKFIVLAASGIGTPRILLNSKNALYPQGLANSSGMVGKNLMLHPLAYIQGEFDEDLQSNWGPQGCAIMSQEFYASRDENSFRRGYTFQLLRGPGPLEWMLSQLRRKELIWGKQHSEFFKSHFNRSADIAAIIEDLPDVNNFIDLDPNLKDRYGIPAPRIHYSLSDNSKKMLAHALTKGKELMKAAGAKSVFAFGPVKDTGWHIMGTARMGSDPLSSIVDKNCKSHDVDNLYIVDSSVFVTSSAVNPANTIQAIALRAGDIIANRLTTMGASRNGST